jgi:hypothetical protein
MAGTKAFKPGLSSDRRMRHAAVKSEPEEGPDASDRARKPQVIADPRGTAVDEYLRPFVEIVRTMEAPQTAPPGQWEHWISAVK